MLDPSNDWPDRDGYDLLSPRNKRELREWVEASPLRTLSSDGKYLYLARERRQGGPMGTVNLPPGEGQAGIPSLDVFHLRNSWGFLRFPIGVTIESVEPIEQGFCLRVSLNKKLKKRFLIRDAVQTLNLPSNPFPLVGLPTSSEDELIVQFAKLLKAGGVMSPGVAMMVRQSSETLALQEKEEREQQTLHFSAYLEAARHAKRYGVPKQLEAAFQGAIKKARLQGAAPLIRSLALQSVRLVTKKGRASAVGASRIGGTPDLGAGMSWPSIDGALYTLLLQVNLAELPKLPGVPLPRKGVLQFYSGHSDSASDPGGKVVYVAKPVVRAELPGDARFTDHHHEYFQPSAVKFDLVVSIPSYGSDAFDLIVGERESDEVVDGLIDLESKLKTPPGHQRRKGLSFIGGHPTCLNEDVGMRLAFGSFGKKDWMVRGCSPTKLKEDGNQERLANWKWWSKNKDRVAAEAHEWICLLDFDSHMEVSSRAGGDMCWWDAGRVQVMIRRSDLAQRNFDAAQFSIVTS